MRYIILSHSLLVFFLALLIFARGYPGLAFFVSLLAVALLAGD